MSSLTALFWECLPVISAVPQGPDLEPCLFLFCINDVAYRLKSTVRLFAADTMTYLTISSEEEADEFQHDMHTVGEWANSTPGKWNFIQQFMWSNNACYRFLQLDVACLLSVFCNTYVASCRSLKVVRQAIVLVLALSLWVPSFRDGTESETLTCATRTLFGPITKCLCFE